MRDRHWKMLMQATGKVFVMDARFALGDLLALELHNYVDACSEIVDRQAAAWGLGFGLGVKVGVWGVGVGLGCCVLSSLLSVASRAPG